jgi:glycerol kinase
VSILVIDVGTSGVRAASVDGDGSVDNVRYVEVLPTSPAPAFVEFDPVAMATAVLDVAHATLEASGPVEGVGIANQRASTIVWDRATGVPVGPGIGWQDLRTVGTCLALQAQGIRVAPNESATKLAMLLDLADPDRTRDLCFGTVDTWVVWTLTNGSLHVTDASNSGVTGLRGDGTAWNDTILEVLRIPPAVLPTVVDSSEVIGPATALPGAPPIAGIAGDQQASLVGQGCTRPGLAKVTFGTGGMLDCCVGEATDLRSPGRSGTFPIAAWQRQGRITWGVEAIMLSAGSCVEWLRDDLGIIATAAESGAVAARCDDTGDVWFVPALLGHGHTGVGLRCPRHLRGHHPGHRSPRDGPGRSRRDRPPGGRSARGGRVRHRTSHPSLRVDGGMSANPTFIDALADATGGPSRCRPSSRPPPWAPPIWPAWPSVCGPTRRRWRRPGHRPVWSSPG